MVGNKHSLEQAKENLARLVSAVEETAPVSKNKVILRFWHEDSGVLRVPIIILKGDNTDQTLWLQAGVHGDEYDGPIACLRLADTLPLDKIKGTILICPVVNSTAFFSMQHNSKYDNINLNRTYYENNETNFSHQYGGYWYHIISNVANFMIDLHGANKHVEIAEMIWINNSGSSADAESNRIARCTGFDYIGVDRNDINDPKHRNRLGYALSQLGIPALIPENGAGLAWRERSVQKHITQTKQILFEAGYLLEGSPMGETGKRFIALQNLYVEKEGLMIYSAPMYTDVKKGDVLVKILDIETLEVHEMVSPVDNAFVFVRYSAAVAKKDEIAIGLARYIED